MTLDAKTIINLFGGIKPLANAIGKDPATIYRWTYPKSKGGTDGRVPSSAAHLVRQAAAARDISLVSNDSKTLSQTPHPHQFINWFRNTVPYIQAHRGKTFVISFNGEAIEDELFSEMMQDFALLNSLGIQLILVHGIRPQLEKKLSLANIDSAVIKHLRVTTKDILHLAKEAVGNVRTTIEAELTHRLANTAMSSTNTRVTSGNFITAKPIGVIDGIDYQHTGEVRNVDADSLSTNLRAGHIVLISPLAYSPTGDVFNLRGEDVATAIAASLRADKLILLTEQTELLDENNNVIRQLTTKQAETLLNNPKNSQNDAYLHLREAIDASKQGVKRIHLINRKINGALQLELFTRKGSGTLISAHPFEDARQATIDDVQGIMELIKPLEMRGLLSHRTTDSIEHDIKEFYVIEQDGLITTCAALHEYPAEKAGELACVAVHPDYRSGERGEYLLSMIEKKALSKGLSKLFVLTTQSSHWFLERGFLPATLADLPAKKQHLYNKTRRSQVLIKHLSK
ncbi:MAG: amino-acid N-acetyltransferase [Piscirickettsiaceae bacterium]|nr:MAG: amino-acid N-acetyltransferase [Piscirickettsiaceae bacterium]PCI69491.1 MAG: amino-acid N-acetyltransferase [Piscirickettsiaceae bacterium]